LNFVTAQAASRLVIVIVTSVVVYAGTDFFLGFMMKGSYVNLLAVTTLAIISMIAIGLVFASRLKSEELASGLLNLVTFPMLIFSGVFFSLEGSPQLLQSFSRALPLTHFIEAARAIMLDGAGFLEVAPNMLYLAAVSAGLLFVSSLMFRWE
jgi:ABC-type polysaccharide/polyol phosphate export permease